MSPQRHIDKLTVPIVASYGVYETPEFQRQAHDFAAAVNAAGRPVELIEGLLFGGDGNDALTGGGTNDQLFGGGRQ